MAPSSTIFVRTLQSNICDVERAIISSLLYNDSLNEPFYIKNLDLMIPDNRFKVYLFAKCYPNKIYMSGQLFFPFGPLLFTDNDHADLFDKQTDNNLIPFGFEEGELKETYFVKDPNEYDNIMSSLNFSDDSMPDLHRLMSALSLLDKWAWILTNSKSARRVMGGWLFASNTDAIHFKLLFLGSNE